MAYIGQNADGNFTTSVSKDTFSGNGSTTAFTLSEGATTNTVDVFVENIRQEPTTAYSVDGTTLTFTAAPVTGTDNIYVVNRGPIQLSASHPAAQALTAHSATITNDLTVDTDTLFVDASADAVGIGTTSLTAARVLTVNHATAPTQSFEQNGTEKYWSGIAGSASFGVNESASGDYFARTSGGKMLFSTDSGTTANAVIDSAGHVGIGTTSPQGDGIHIVAPDSGTGLVLSGTTATAGTEVRLSALNEATTAWHNLNIGGNNVILRAAGIEKARITTDGLTFNGDTAAVNALSDYQEGTWTASLGAVTTDPTVASITNNQGVYTKIGDLVYIQWYSGAINITNAGSGIGYISGLPFSPSISPQAAQQYASITFTHTTAFANQIQNGYTVRSGAYIFAVREGQTNGTGWNTGSPYYIMMSGVYRTDG